MHRQSPAGVGAPGRDVGGLSTSSSLKAIMETARKTALVEPVMVVMRSGQDPSEMVMRALLWGQCHTPSGTSQALCFITSPRDSLSRPPPTCPRQPSLGCCFVFPGFTGV